MRPLRLELAGFTAFRDPVAVDFEGADLFALSGPTGAGKSSLIDAVCFALYGSVPRLDRRTVAPIISTGKLETRVRFDFTVGDRAYTAVRVVRAQSSGRASTKEARLESQGEVIAGDADEVTGAVESLVGLDFDQFTKCVVLPQGEFARFLHDTPRGRQDLLVRLLDLGVYTTMRQAARTREETAKAGGVLLEQQLGELTDATPERLAAAERRASDLEALRGELDAAQPHLDALAGQRRDADAELADATARAELLGRVTIPEGVSRLSDEVAAAEAAADAASVAYEHADVGLRSAEDAVDELPDRAALERLRNDWEQHAAVAERIDNGTPILTAAREEEQRARDFLDGADGRLVRTREELEGARIAHAADDLAGHLRAGQPCPVCAQRVEQVPERQAHSDLRAAQRAVREAERQRKEAESALRDVAGKRARAEQTMQDLHVQQEALTRHLADEPEAAQVQRLLEKRSALERARDDARAAEREARSAVRRCAEAAAVARERRDRAWAVLDTARDALAALGPPTMDRRDLSGSWKNLATWAEAEAVRQRERARHAETRRSSADEARARLERKLAGRCRELGVDVASGSLIHACADALASARASRDQLAQDHERRERWQAELANVRETAAVAHELAQHLRSNRFEQWLLDEALERLAAGAGRTLRTLSGGQYSLEVDRHRNFAVIDHHNADERRPARTLSGGETFLASLALALTLAEHLAEMAVGVAPRLESIFLDEGFGTLDAATLDVVAAAIEELGATGRTVGLVTHVRDLAERMPVRFEVRKGPSTSSIERVML